MYLFSDVVESLMQSQHFLTLTQITKQMNRRRIIQKQPKKAELIVRNRYIKQKVQAKK